MDARITAEAAELTLFASPTVTVTTVIVVDDLDIALVSLCDAAVILAPFLTVGGSSLSAVPAPLFHEREVSALAFAG